MKRREGWLWLFAAMGLAGCAAADPQTDMLMVRRRASFDLNCPEEQIRGQWLDDKTLGVTACGQRATYVKLCHSDVTTSPLAAAMTEECQWLMNGDSRPSRPPTPEGQ